MDLRLPDRSIDMRIATEFLGWGWIKVSEKYLISLNRVCVEDTSKYLKENITTPPDIIYPYHFVALPRFSESLGACEKIIAKFAVSYNFQLHVNKNHSIAVVWDDSDNTLQGTGTSPAEAIVDLCVKYMDGQLC